MNNNPLPLLFIILAFFLSMLATAILSEARSQEYLGWEDRAAAAAKATWLGEPCKGDWVIVTDDLEDKKAGEAEWHTPYEDPYFRPQENFDCVIRINDPNGTMSWGDKCTYTIHEWGHLMGKKHNNNQKSVMYPYGLVTHKRCRGKKHREVTPR